MGSKAWLGFVFLSLAASIWGGMYVVSKWTLEILPPFTLVWLRYLVAFGILWIFLAKRRREKITVKDHMGIAAIGFIGYFISISAQFVGTWLSSAAMGALITSATPAFMLIFAYWFLKERLNWHKGIAVLLATAGVTVVVGMEIPTKVSFLGNIILVIAALTWAMLSVGAKKLGERLSSLLVTTYAIGYAIIFTTPVMIWESTRQQVDWDVLLQGDIVAAVLYLGVISTAVAFFLWNQGLVLVEAGVGGMFFFFQPVVGSFLGWFILGEQLGWGFFAGGALILTGVILSTWDRKAASATYPIDKMGTNKA